MNRLSERHPARIRQQAEEVWGLIFFVLMDQVLDHA